MLTLLLVVVLVLIIAGAPGWGHHSYGWGPSGILGVILIVLLIHFLAGRL
jgi:hypothetical protein